MTVGAHWVSWLVVAGPLGPTAYVLIAHPQTASARVRSAVIGHGSAFAVGLAAVAAWGGWGHSFQLSHHPQLDQGIAVAVAAEVLLLVLELSDAHQAPTAATVALVASGLVAIGRPLAALAASLALVIALATQLARVPIAADDVSREV